MRVTGFRFALAGFHGGLAGERETETGDGRTRILEINS